MNKILEFFQKELNSCNENKSIIDNQIYRAKLDIEFVRITKKKIISDLDNTYNVFNANGNDSNFTTREISSLKQQEDELSELILVKSAELEEVKNRIFTINEMIVESKNKINECNENNSDNDINILKIQEAERQRIARDIHDSVVQRLTVLIHKSEFAMKVIDSDPLRAKLELDVINKVVKDCIDELRIIISGLRPMSLDDLGLETTLRSAISQLKNFSDMDIDLKYNIENFVNIKSIVSISILRIIQELCCNAIKYSEGSKIVIEISNTKENLILSFEDDGIGFSGCENTHVSNNENSGFGIPILKERVKLLRGYIKIGKNIENKGVRYDIEIPSYSEEK